MPYLSLTDFAEIHEALEIASSWMGPSDHVDDAIKLMEALRDAPDQPDIVVSDRAKLEAVAKGYYELMELTRQQQAIQAKLIRECLRRIVVKPGPFDDNARRMRIVRDRSEALIGLADLAEMLERQSQSVR